MALRIPQRIGCQHHHTALENVKGFAQTNDNLVIFSVAGLVTPALQVVRPRVAPAWWGLAHR